MIPHLLKIKGLYSYREAVEIDFDRLSEEGLFGIFGAVGSGKSAILEAMTFALFGNTERMNSRENRGYNMMNLQSQELQIEFEFSLNKGNNDRFRFAVRQTRNSKQFDKINTAQRSAYKWVAENWLPLENTDASEVLGLSYDNFTKTIIIPQGKFQAFLHMGQKDRTEMFKEMFHLDQFDLWEPTRRLGNETRDELLRLDEQLKSLESATEEELKALELKVLALAEEIGKGKEQEKLLAEALQRHQQLKKTAEEIRKSKEALAKLEAASPEMAQRSEKLKRFQMVRLEFGAILEQAKRLAQQLADQGREIKQLEAETAAQAQHLENAKERLKNAEQAMVQKPQMELELQDCQHWMAIKASEETVLGLAKRLENGAEALNAKQQELAQSEALMGQKSAQLLQLRATMPDQQRLGDIRLWFQQQTQLKQEKQQLLHLKGQTEAALAQNKASIQQELAALGLSSSDSEKLAQHRAARLSSIEKLRQEKEKLSQQLGLAAFALHLHEGEACPLCGSEAHPHPYDSSEAAAKLADAEKAFQQAESDFRSMEAALQRIQRLSDQLSMRQEQFEKYATEAQRLENRIAEHLKRFVWSDFDPAKEEALQAELERAKSLEAQIKDLEAETQQKEAQLKEIRSQLEQYQAAIQKIKDDHIRGEGELENRKQQLRVLGFSENSGKNKEFWQQKSVELQQALQKLQAEFEQSQQAEKQASLRAVQLNERLSSLSNEQAKGQAEQEAIAKQLSEKMADKGFAAQAELQAILAQNMDVEQEEKAISAHREALLANKASLQTLEQAMGGAAYDQAAHDQAEIAAATLQQQLAENQAELTLGQDRLQNMGRQLAQKAHLFDRQTALQKRQENLKVLESLFKGAGFVQYVSTIYLKELVARADERFRRLTRNMLKLELDDEAEFQVRDMLNGGQLRSVKTLSGGQTFQASLCLALALADNMAARSGSRQNFFFLDEGFGTLDRDSLAAVFDTLKELRNEQRVVGVISHVEELQQEIETHLRVQQSEARGSWVQGSWE